MPFKSPHGFGSGAFGTTTIVEVVEILNEAALPCYQSTTPVIETGVEVTI